MTEEEAATKWCPFARVTDIDGKTAASNRWENIDDEDDSFGPQANSYCLGSKCMAWRVSGRGGYCGLVGEPR